MQIIINGKLALLKKGSSFQFISENRLFTGSDSYTLSITFPLKGCAQNLAIFGHLNRNYSSYEQLTYDCSIIDKVFQKRGIITITSVSELEIKTQFLEGRSVQNYDVRFDEIYINEMSLGKYNPENGLVPVNYWRSIDTGVNSVALPWVNNSSGNIQNQVKYNVQEKGYRWHTDTKGISHQPYLVFILKQMAASIQYSLDIQEIMNSNYRFLIICNTLPFAWGNTQWKSILPHWTLTEFFEQIGNVLGGDFLIDHSTKTISFRFTQKEIDAMSSLSLQNVVDSFSVEVSEDNKCPYVENTNIAYADCDHQAWKAYSCDWYLKQNWFEVMHFETLDELDNFLYKNMEYGVWYANPKTKDMLNRIFHVAEIGTYFVLRCYNCKKAYDSNFWYQRYVLMSLNVFGPKVVDRSENAETIELNCVPAWIDNVDENNWSLYLDVPEYDEKPVEESFQVTNDSNGWKPSGQQVGVVNELLQGEMDKGKEYFDKIYLAFWDGKIPIKNTYPFPTIDHVMCTHEYNFILSDYSLRLKDAGSLYPKPGKKYDLDTSKKFKFSFLAKSIPDVRSVFYIKGQRYLCEKITATFTESGMSQLLKGDFYRIK